MSTTGTLATTLGVDNPYRYRGYRYDNETGLYYVTSRYYDPNIGRFLNADDMILLATQGDLLGANLFAYCNNNPVMNSDPSGYLVILLPAIEVLLLLCQAIAIVCIIGIIVIGIIGTIYLVKYYIDLLVQQKYGTLQKSVTRISKDLGEIAEKHGDLKCKEAADAMRRYLKRLKLHGAVITIAFVGDRGWVWSESMQKVISENGIQVGILFMGQVYCNIHPYGLPKLQWISDFMGPG